MASKHKPHRNPDFGRTEKFVDVHCHTVEQFLSEISPFHARFKAKDPRQWIHRGQGHDYPLLPSAFRATHGPSFKHQDQIQEELDTIKLFFELADASGLTLPEDTQTLRYAMRDDLWRTRHFLDLRNGKAEWPPKELLSLLGIAQHYGQKTRMLDWTRNSYKAAYFAAEGHALADESHGPIKKMTVWSYYLHAHEQDRTIGTIMKDKHRRVDIVTAPYSSNPNLCAQEGLFMAYIPKKVPIYEKFMPEAFNSFLGEFNYRYGGGHLPPVLIKFTLDATQDNACGLLKSLARVGVTGASMFPGFSGVSKAMNEHAVWRDPVVPASALKPPPMKVPCSKCNTYIELRHPTLFKDNLKKQILINAGWQVDPLVCPKCLPKTH